MSLKLTQNNATALWNPNCGVESTQVYLDHLKPFLKFLKKVPRNVPRKVPSFRVFQNVLYMKLYISG